MNLLTFLFENKSDFLKKLVPAVLAGFGFIWLVKNAGDLHVYYNVFCWPFPKRPGINYLFIVRLLSALFQKSII